MPTKASSHFEGIAIDIIAQGTTTVSVYQAAGEETKKWDVKPGDAVFMRMKDLNPSVNYDDELRFSLVRTRSPLITLLTGQNPRADLI